MFQTHYPLQLQFFELAPVPMMLLNELGEIIETNRECDKLFHVHGGDPFLDHYLKSDVWSDALQYFQTVSISANQDYANQTFSAGVQFHHRNDPYALRINLIGSVPSPVYIAVLSPQFTLGGKSDHLLDRAPLAMALVDSRGHFVHVNALFANLLGYQQEDLYALTEADITFASDANSEMPMRANLTEQVGDQYQVDKRYFHQNGHQIWVRTFVSSFTSELTKQRQFVIAVLDIHEEKQLQDVIATSERRFRTIAENVSSVVWISSADPERLFYVNKCYDLIFEENVGTLYHDPRAFLEKVHPSDRELAESTRFATTTESWNINYRLLFDDGRVKHIRDSGNCVFDGSGELIYRVGTLTDITSEIDQRDTVVVMAKRLRELVEYDSLTGIKSRHAIMNDIQDAYKDYNATGVPSMLVYIDADGFKNINDSYGHDVGDKVLKAIANHLTSNIRESDEAGRIGGDEFVVLLRRTAETETPHILERLKTDIECDGLPDGVNVSISLGAIELSDDVNSAEQWLSDADKTMYQHKRARKKTRLAKVPS